MWTTLHLTLHLLSNGQCLFVNDSWSCVGHGSNESDATSQGGSCARGKVLLVGLSRVTDMDVGVDEAGQTDDAVGGDTVDVGLHGRSIESEEVERLDSNMMNRQEYTTPYT